jgi:hypothetical protein
VTPLGLIVDALAVFRLTKLVNDDEITADLRDKILERFHPEDTKIGYLITCPWCVSIWAGGAVALARELAPRSWNVAASALAFSALTGLAAEKI